MRRFVVIETPYFTPALKEVARNVRYARACVRDSLLRGEIPFASHLIYTQPGITNDKLPKERKLGIMTGMAINKKLNATAIIYTDLGISGGMKLGIKMAKRHGRKIEYRRLGKGWEKKFSKQEHKHPYRAIW
jgi:hypothetical protein